MALISSSKLFYINSSDRVSGTDSDFLYAFQMPADVKFDKVCVLQVCIPKSYYLVQANEYFTLTEGANSVNITPPVGNYTRKSLASTLQTLLSLNSPNRYTYAVTYPNSSTIPDTGKYTFLVTGNGGVQPIFTFATTNDLWDHMGFASGSTNNFVGNSLTSTNVINLQKENTLYLHSDIVNNGSDNILQEVFSVQSADYSSIVFQQYNIDGYSKDLVGNSNNVYRFYLSDETGNQIDLNGQNLNFTLLMYKKNNIYNMIKQFLKLQAVQKVS
jgi:hypothetical protein